MKPKLISSLPAKITAIILSYLMVVVLIISAAAVLFMGYGNFYFETKQDIIESTMRGFAENELYNIFNKFEHGIDLEEYYSNKNIYYTITDSSGEILSSNYNGEDCIVAKSDSLHDEYIDEIVSITVYVAKDMKKIDTFSITCKLIDIGYKLRYWVIVFAFVAVVGIIALLSFLYCSAGHKAGREGVSLNYLDLLPFDVYTAIVAVALTVAVLFIFDVYWEGFELFISLFAVGTLCYFLVLGYTMSFATRVKTRTLIKNTLIYRFLKVAFKLFKKFGKAFAYILKGGSVLKKSMLCTAAFIALGFIYFFSCMYEPDVLFIGLILFSILLAAVVFYLAFVLQKIKDGGEKIVSGDFEHKIDTKYMHLDFKDFAESLNNINEGMQNAVNEKMKSERFKTELITNVSHDLKTPLTSIINYVDLLEKEKIENEAAKEYIEVLKRQSVRLKKLVEDLVEASKASTGNLSVNLSDCNVSVLLSQAVGEFDDRLSSAGITPVLKVMTDDVKIKADARHLWRVFDNLLSNICKYSLPQSRAYIDVVKEYGKVIITFRNISKYELNLSSDELMERFVRGDSSRNTEGSGLGLSIAKSLVELQNGSMSLEVDGDLFKATLEFQEAI